MAPRRKASASQINLYLSCPRKWFMRYKLGIKEPQSIALVKGSFIHEVIEEFYKLKPKGSGFNLTNYREKFYSYSEEVFDKVLKRERKVFGKPAPSFEKEFKAVCKDEFVYACELEDSKDIVHNYMTLFIMQFTQHARGVQYFSQAWYSARPKFSELEFNTKDFIGYADAIVEKDNALIVCDYKTSSMYKLGYSEEYERQVKLYAAMYYKQHGVMPDYGCIIFLRYGVQCFYKIDKDTVEQECDELLDWFYANTISDKIEDYPCNHDGQFCTSACSKHCDGFKGGSFRCFYDQYCNQELEGKKIIFPTKN